MLEFNFKVKVGGFQLTAESGQAVAQMGLFGPSGCGKTTLLNCLAGLVRPREGRIALNGQVLFDSTAGRHVPVHKRGIGYMFQDARLFPHMTVRDNITYGLGRSSKGPTVEELARVLDLESLFDRLPANLSGGEQQRVALARALAPGPKLLLLDEPLGSTDREARLRIMTYLKDAYHRWHVPFVYVSHSVTEMLFLTERAWQMKRGTIHRSVPPRDLLSAVDSHTSQVSNILNGTIVETPEHTGYVVVRSGDQPFKVPGNGDMKVGQPVAMAVPARDIILCRNRPEGVSARNLFEATVESVKSDGKVLWVTVDARGSRLVVELTEDAGIELHLQPGKTVYVMIKTHSITATRVKGIEGDV